jgi:hypothetical protein
MKDGAETHEGGLERRRLQRAEMLFARGRQSRDSRFRTHPDQNGIATTASLVSPHYLCDFDSLLNCLP